MPALGYDNEKFIFACKFDERMIAKNAGLRWDSERKYWYTPDLQVAVRLREFAIGFAKTKLSKVIIDHKPWPLPLPVAPSGLHVMDHQKEAIKFALERNRCYLGLDPGLGKTICAALISTAIKQPTVYITPPFLVRNVEEEFLRWAPQLRVRVFKTKVLSTYRLDYDVLVVPDSLLVRSDMQNRIREFIKERGLVIVDEAHRFKNSDAKRTMALFGGKKKQGLVDLFERQIYMSGTPMPNRPVELFPVLNKAAPECIDFMNFFEYGRKYCGGHKNQYGWDFSGATNMQELSRRIKNPERAFMLRQKKSLLNLPPKIEEVFVVSDNMSTRLVKFDQAVREACGSSDPDDSDIKAAILENAGLEEWELHVATYRRLLGMEKAEPSIEYIKSLLTETEENVLVFAYHKDVIKKLVEGLHQFKPLVATGETSIQERHDTVKEFQNSKDRRLFIGNYIAAGIGFTLTKATRVIFVEFDWVPGVNEQASDRAHRIGQNESVLVQYVVYKDSIDKAVIDSLLNKKRSIKHI